ncbi:[NiFe]-hydrogenase assembly chaperone HybE [Marivita hallyeonensis]|uniref:[NiFe] hydrogenase assembly chaperone, HybE family n=1 Tax=Marivita hallyeonensis TaxID=996342 RepID=A0A1M5MLR3_9RHOB|nr:[NiFe]-hydrogenase assembly chaperone HybE [Marivita hallyeonensis]SHG77849.1 [NiFe] hydrogenase assembly chaperone, HybE family [Marivita hallyeonensis]
MTTFEGSYLGATDKISPLAIMECKICWTPYDPAEGDDVRQIDPGTPFVALPDDWSCPNCSAPPEQFLVREDPGAPEVAETAFLNECTKALAADFTEIWNAKMKDVPIVNKLLHVQAVGFRMHEGRPLGVLISPWFMNLIQLPGKDETWDDLTPGEKELIAFPSGAYEFIHNTREQTGGYKACSLFSPMGDFNTQAQAVDVGKAVMQALFDEANRAETDRSADIRSAREAELAALEETDEPQLDDTPTRRKVITGGIAAGTDG